MHFLDYRQSKLPPRSFPFFDDRWKMEQLWKVVNQGRTCESLVDVSRLVCYVHGIDRLFIYFFYFNYYFILNKNGEIPVFFWVDGFAIISVYVQGRGGGGMD